MSAIAGVSQSPIYDRANPVKQQIEVAQNDEKRVNLATENKENIQQVQEQREQAKAPVNKGEGTLVDKEA